MIRSGKSEKNCRIRVYLKDPSSDDCELKKKKEIASINRRIIRPLSHIRDWKFNQNIYLFKSISSCHYFKDDEDRMAEEHTSVIYQTNYFLSSGLLLEISIPVRESQFFRNRVTIKNIFANVSS